MFRLAMIVTLGERAVRMLRAIKQPNSDVADGRAC